MSQEQDLPTITFTIPDGLEFSDLQVRRHPEDGRVGFNMMVFATVMEASNLLPQDVAHIPHEQFCSMFLSAWYAAHLAQGGEKDAVMEQLHAEIEADEAFEAAAEGKFIHEPGRA